MGDAPVSASDDGALPDSALAPAGLRRRVPAERALLTFLETEALNARFREAEAEAVLLGDPGAPGL